MEFDEMNQGLRTASTNINNNVYQLMLVRDVSVEKLSKATGLTRQSIYHTINNTKLVSFKKAFTYSRYFGVTIDELMR